MNKRIHNFDLLKSTIMLFIIIWHSIVHGLNIAQEPIIFDFQSITSILNYFIIKLLMYITVIGVNCFILITGHFMINYNKNIWPRFFKIWGVTSFYSLLISFIFYICNLTTYGLGGVVFSAFPIYNGEYWFVTKYLGLIILVPFLIKISNKLTQKEFLIGIISLSILTIYIPPFLNYGNIYSGPNNLLFFINLFYIGGYIAQYNPFSNSKRIGSLFLLLVLFLSMYDLIFSLYNNKIYQQDIYLKIDDKLSNNNITFISSILFFLYFKYQKIKISKITNLIINTTPYTFGIYLIHENDEIRKFLWNNLNLSFQHETACFIIIILLYSVLIYCICVLIDYFRKKCQRLLHIDRFIENISYKIDKSKSHYFF